MLIRLPLLTLLLATSAAFAIDAGAVKRADDKAAAWLIDQFVLKTKSFGNATAPEHLAMAIKGICDSSRDYKEASGPFVTEPVKSILARIDEKGSAKDIVLNEAEALGWIITGLKATGSDKYKDAIEKVRARMKAVGNPAFPKFEAAHLTPTTATPESMRFALAAVLKAAESGTKEIDVDGMPVKWAEVLGESLIKLQQPDGSFGPDIVTNALALCTLNWCYKSLK